MWTHAETLIGEIRDMLDNRGIKFTSIEARVRYEQDTEEKEGDQTILIMAPRRSDNGWKVFLYDIDERLGPLDWRVEFIDLVAVKGWKGSHDCPGASGMAGKR